MSTSTISTDEVIGARVHQMMWRQKISQTQMATRLGIHQTALSKKLRGERKWSTDELLITAKTLGVTVGVLFGESDSPKDGPPPIGAPSSMVELQTFNL